MAILNGTNLTDIINGTSLADTIFGNGDNDRLIGHGGDDVIRGGAGQDIVEGGDGDDILYADGGASVLVGAGGEDVLFGGAGSDILISSAGRDHFNGGSGVDAASWQDAFAGVVANLGTGRAVSAGVEDTFTGVENLIGSRFNDTLQGDGGRNELFGADGADKLYGGGGNDHLSGGAGNDTLDGGAGSNSLKGGAGVDTADYLAAPGFVHVNLASGSAVTDDRFDSLVEIEAVRGSNAADSIIGDEFGNRLSGMLGNDLINGGAGDDALTGGGGADTFVFSARSPSKFSSAIDSGLDRITDFDRVAGDRIDLTGHKAATDFADLRAEASQFGTDTHLRLGVDTIVLEDVTISELSASMFLF